MMTIEEILDDILQGTLRPPGCPTEAQFHKTWLEHDLSTADPVSMALRGGALADRLAWVFVAGYQAAVRRVFPGLPVEPGWCSFVNTEDRSGALPGTTLTGESGNRRLSGWKTWVATADHVGRLLVSARQNEAPFAVVRRDQPGVHLSTDPPKSYLSEMSQGRVEFVNIEVPDSNVLGDERTFPIFRPAEPAYVRAALNAFTLSHLCRLSGPPTLISRAAAGVCSAAAVLSLPLPSDTASVAIAGFDADTRALAGDFATYAGAHDPALHKLWTKDKRLIEGASQTIIQRAEVVLAHM